MNARDDLPVAKLAISSFYYPSKLGSAFVACCIELGNGLVLDPRDTTLQMAAGAHHITAQHLNRLAMRRNNVP